uniref:Uncharacterized protein n=1 Tax=Amphimedon queenslandica TaxID=400682 RepID=A0A1X7TEH8_AMPQE
MKLVVSKCSS